jgi:hypothetical protein
MFFDSRAATADAAAVAAAGEMRLRPGGRLPGTERLPAPSAAKPIPPGPPGVGQQPRDVPPASSWKEDSWRSPFKSELAAG